MRTVLIIAALVATEPAAAQDIPHAPNICAAFAKPTGPLNTEDHNRGFGAYTGLNDDFHDDSADPLDKPGAVISDLTRELAQDGDPGVTLLSDYAGLDCEHPYGD